MVSKEEAGPREEEPGGDHRKRVLVIGGTQFMGRHTVEALLAARWRVCTLNRGKTPSFAVVEQQFVCDRFADRAEVRRVVQECGPWDCVIDFVAFSAEDARDAMGASRYLYVSSDSVFMAGDRDVIEARRNKGLVESDCRRETRRSAKGALRRRNGYQFRYGSGKLEIEEELARWPEVWSTSIRLPDVIGPYDNLDGFLGLCERLRNGRKTVGCAVPGADEKHRASVAFAPDVAAALTLLAGLQERPPPVMHLACVERPSVAELVGLVSDALGRPPPALDPTKRAPILTVDIGPLDISLALTTLHPWRPTALKEAVRRTVQWYEAPKNVDYTRALAEDSDSSESDDDKTAIVSNKRPKPSPS